MNTRGFSCERISTGTVQEFLISSSLEYSTVLAWFTGHVPDTQFDKQSCSSFHLNHFIHTVVYFITEQQADPAPDTSHGSGKAQLCFLGVISQWRLLSLAPSEHRVTDKKKEKQWCVLWCSKCWAGWERKQALLDVHVGFSTLPRWVVKRVL